MPPCSPKDTRGEWREVFGVHGVIHSLKAIRTAKETNHQKARVRKELGLSLCLNRGLTRAHSHFKILLLTPQVASELSSEALFCSIEEALQARPSPL